MEVPEVLTIAAWLAKRLQTASEPSHPVAASLSSRRVVASDRRFRLVIRLTHLAIPAVASLSVTVFVAVFPMRVYDFS